MSRMNTIYIILFIILISAFTFTKLMSPSDMRKPIMYGSYSCSHCAHQKELINSSEYEYIECNTENSIQSETCIKANVYAYPTWVFPGGERVGGVISQEEFERYNHGK